MLLVFLQAVLGVTHDGVKILVRWMHALAFLGSSSLGAVWTLIVSPTHRILTLRTIWRPVGSVRGPGWYWEISMLPSVSPLRISGFP